MDGKETNVETTETMTDETTTAEVEVPEDGDQGKESGVIRKIYSEEAYKELQKHSREHEKNARKLNEQLEATKKELEAANAAKEEALAELTTLRSANERNALVATIASEEEVDATILAQMIGEDEDAIRKNAQMLKGLKPKSSYPKVADSGDPGKFKTATREDILSIKDQKEQRKRIYENLELF